MCSVGACSGRRCAGTENDKKKRQAAMTCPFSSNRFYGYGVPLPSVLFDLFEFHIGHAAVVLAATRIVRCTVLRSGILCTLLCTAGLLLG